MSMRWLAVTAFALAGCGGPSSGGSSAGSSQGASSPDSGGAPLTAAECPTLAAELLPAGSCRSAQGTCSTDADCQPTGCGGQICASTSLVSTCIYRPCYDVPSACRCVRGCCVVTAP